MGAILVRVVMLWSIMLGIFFFSNIAISVVHGLSLNYYDKTCPQAEAIVNNAVKKAVMADKKVIAALLRMHFHDCFIRGCDGSVLLNSVGHSTAEKDAPPNQSLHAYYIIDSAKNQVEKLCPGVVSCADLLALAARDAVVQAGGPYWQVFKGRLDGRVSRASETSLLPSPTFNFSQLLHSFSLRGLTGDDLVALSGGHTLGFSHCSSFQSRIHNFDATHDVDPTLNRYFAERLKNICPAHNTAKNAGSTMDSSSTTFDNTYYRLLIQGKSLFSSDHSLLSTEETKRLVYKFASSQMAFRQAFVKSITKMSSLTGGQEVRLKCGKVN